MNGEANIAPATSGEGAQVAISYDAPGQVVTLTDDELADPEVRGFIDDRIRCGDIVEIPGSDARPAAVPELQHAAAAAGRQDGGALREGDGRAAVSGQLAEARRVITFRALGVPAPKGSGRAILVKGRAMHVPSGSDVNRDALKSWDVAVREAARAAIGDVDAPPFIETAIEISIVFHMKRPAGHYRKDGSIKPSAPRFPHAKPDVSKLARATEDTLTGIVFDDDARIVTSHTSKRWARPGEEGASITVSEA